jgi:hypothetical protein
MQIDKKCTSCEIIKAIEEFGNQAGTKDGLKYICKSCNSLTSKRRYATHKDVHIRKVNKWQIENAEKVRKYKAEWAAKQLAAPDPEKK